MSNELAKIEPKKVETRGGKREGAGRKIGAKNIKTIEKTIAKQLLETRVLRSMDKLLDSQMNVALGCHFLFKVPRGNKRPILIKDREVIRAYLAGELDKDKRNQYYFLTSEKPDTRAIDSLLDRVFGKSKNKFGFGSNSDEDTPLEINVINYGNNNPS